MMEGGKTNARLKAEARKRLLGNYGNAAGAVAVMYFAFVVIMTAVMLIFMLPLISYTVSWPFSYALPALILLGIALGVFLMLTAAVFIGGYVRMCRQVALGYESGLKDLLYGWNHHCGRFVGLAALISVCYLLCSLPYLAFSCASSMGILELPVWAELTVETVLYIVTVVLSIVLLCRFYLAFFALADDPEKRLGEALAEAGELLEGNRLRMVKLEISFIGVMLLGYLSFGIGLCWVFPYMVCTNVLFYEELKAEKRPAPAAENFWGYGWNQ